MPGILGDIDIVGYLNVLLQLFQDESRREFWQSLNFRTPTFQDLGLPANASDWTIWEKCQQEELVLITGNRNRSGPLSLEAVIQAQNTVDSLPVITLASPKRISRSKPYAGRVADRRLEYLFDLDRYRGTGRLYVP